MDISDQLFHQYKISSIYIEMEVHNVALINIAISAFAKSLSGIDG